MMWYLPRKIKNNDLLRLQIVEVLFGSLVESCGFQLAAEQFQQGSTKMTKQMKHQLRQAFRSEPEDKRGNPLFVTPRMKLEYLLSKGDEFFIDLYQKCHSGKSSKAITWCLGRLREQFAQDRRRAGVHTGEMEPNWYEILLEAYQKIDSASPFTKTRELVKRHKRSMGQRLRQIRRKESKVEAKVKLLLARQKQRSSKHEPPEQNCFMRAGGSKVSHLSWECVWLSISRLLETDKEVQEVASDCLSRAALDTKTFWYEDGLGARRLNRGNEAVDFVFKKLGLNGDDWLEEQRRLGNEAPAKTAVDITNCYFRCLSESDKYNFDLWRLNGHCHTIAPLVLILMEKLFPEEEWEILTGRPGGRTKTGHSLVANKARTKVADFIFRSPEELPNHYAEELAEKNGFGEFLLLLADEEVKPGQTPPETVEARNARDPIYLAMIRNMIMEQNFGFGF